MIDGNPIRGRVFPISQPRYRKAVAASPLGEEERNLEKWPMTSSD